MTAISMEIDALDFRTVQETLTQLPRRLRDRACRRGVTKAGRLVAREAKAGAPRRTGLLAQSQGQKVVRKKTGDYTAVVGPRRGFKRAVVRTARRTFRKATKREIADKKFDGYRDPVRYAHLVENPHRLVRGGRVVGQTAGTRFLHAALDRQRTACQQIIATECSVELQKMRAGPGA